MAAAICPCARLGAHGKPLAHAACCGPWLAGQRAPDAEALMRSRYSAFVLARADYLLATWHASTRPADLQLESDAKWLGLDIKDHQVLDESHAEVEFVARQRDRSGRAVRLHERSRFVREEGRWLYVDDGQK